MIQAVYTALKETEQRATDLLPIWKARFRLFSSAGGAPPNTSVVSPAHNPSHTIAPPQVPALAVFSPRQQKATAAVELIRRTTEELISKCKEIVEREQEFASLDSEYINDADPSVLRFLLASRVEVTEQQLRDDLLSMLVAGHETTGSVLTWTLKLLVENPDKMAKAMAEADRVIGDAEVLTLAVRAPGRDVPASPARSALSGCVVCAVPDAES